jgi:hypothetical protein
MSSKRKYFGRPKPRAENITLSLGRNALNKRAAEHIIGYWTHFGPEPTG